MVFSPVGPLYQTAVNTAGPLLALAASLKGRFGGRWQERLGFIGDNPGSSSEQRLWFHCASVGETRSAATVIRRLLEMEPGLFICLSVGTPAGLVTAESIFKNESRIKVAAAPVDFWGSPGRAFKRAAPAAVIIWETELWPNFINSAKKSGARLILGAARMTERSFRRYLKVRGFMAGLLSNFDLIAAMGPKESGYYAALGANAARLSELGNPKFDHLAAEADSDEFKKKVDFWREPLGPGPLICCGSTHPGEEALLFKTLTPLLARRPDLRLLVAPRHLTRSREVESLARQAGFSAALIDGQAPKAAPGTRVLILNCLGHLSALYALSSAAVVGGSFIDGLMGHNPLEPAAVGRPVIFGPHMASFQNEADGLVRAGGARRLQPYDLGAGLERLLKDKAQADSLGSAARKYLESRPPAAPRLAEAILAALGRKQA